MWNDHPVWFVVVIFVASSVAALAGELKDVNGTRLNVTRIVCRGFYRAVIATASGLLFSVGFDDFRRTLGLAALTAALAPGEKALLKLLPIRFDVTPQQDRLDDSTDPHS